MKKAMQDVQEKFGERVKAVRKKLKMTQSDFGDKIEAATSIISDIESGKRKPGFDLIYKLIYHFKINPSYLFFGEEPHFIGEKPDLPEFNIGDRETFREILWDARRSKLFRYALFEFSAKYKLLNKSLVEEDIANFEAEEKNQSMPE